MQRRILILLLNISVNCLERVYKISHLFMYSPRLLLALELGLVCRFSSFDDQRIGNRALIIVGSFRFSLCLHDMTVYARALDWSV